MEMNFVHHPDNCPQFTSFSGKREKIPFLGSSGWLGHQVARWHGADVHTSLIKGKLSVTTKTLLWVTRTDKGPTLMTITREK
jgi:hypothetical protein